MQYLFPGILVVCIFVVIYFCVLGSKRNRCGRLHRNVRQPPPAARPRLQSCFFAGPDGMLILHNPDSHTEAHSLTRTHALTHARDIQTPDVLFFSLAADHWMSWSTVAQREKRKKTNKKWHTHSHTT